MAETTVASSSGKPSPADTRCVGTPTESDGRKAAREAALALQQAIGARLQRPNSTALWGPAWRHAGEVMAGAAASQDLELRVAARADRAPDCLDADAPPFAQLAALGVGQLCLRQGADPADARALIDALYSLCDGTRAGDDGLLCLADLSNVGLRGASGAGLRPDTDAWASLPSPAPTSDELRSSVERDLAANLPALAARQLLDDAELEVQTVRPILQALLERMLDADDVKSAAWMLGEVERRAYVDPITRDQLFAQARARCSKRFLRAQLEQGTNDALLELAALVVLLGEDVAAAFAAAADEAARPLSCWVSELLRGQP